MKALRKAGNFIVEVCLLIVLVIAIVLMGCPRDH